MIRYRQFNIITISKSNKLRTKTGPFSMPSSIINLRSSLIITTPPLYGEPEKGLVNMYE